MNPQPDSNSNHPTLERYAVVGNPVEHSRSPFIHAAFAQATGQAMYYGRLMCPVDGFVEAVQGFATSKRSAEGATGPARGCNVTVPFKFLAHDLAARRSPRAELAQAANVLRFDVGGWFADNVDGVALVRDIELNAGVDFAGRNVLLLGAGGGASGALGPILQARPKQVRVVNRTLAKAQALVERHRSLALESQVELQAAGLDEPGQGFDILINASASSMLAAGVPLPGSVLRRGALAFDMMYGPAARGFLQWASEHDGSGRDGLGMLVEQAAESFELWRGMRPATAPVLHALRQSLQADTR